MSNEAARLALLERFAEAWNARDVDALMDCMSTDCEFLSSAGPEYCGTRHIGREAVRAAYEAVFEAFREAAWTGTRHIVCGDRGLSEWRFVGRDRNHNPVDVNGCDLFVFDGDFIRTKDSYRKVRSA